MIIQCINCKKKFEVDSALIPEEGRNIQCGACDHTWFYTSKQITTTQKLPETEVIKKNQSTIIKKENTEIENIKEDDLTHEQISHRNADDEKSTNFNIGKILSYFVVVIISFFTLIIILDTFKLPLSSIFPNLELLLYNLFESIKDVLLFLNNLFE
jgi:predicted Zn finger-like uncharacterized protein